MVAMSGGGVSRDRTAAANGKGGGILMSITGSVYSACMAEDSASAARAENAENADFGLVCPFQLTIPDPIQLLMIYFLIRITHKCQLLACSSQVQTYPHWPAHPPQLLSVGNSTCNGWGISHVEYCPLQQPGGRDAMPGVFHIIRCQLYKMMQ